LVVVCLVFLSGLFWIKSHHGLQWVQSRINADIPGKISIASIQLSLLQPHVDLGGVVLQDPQGGKLAGFSHFSVGLDWLRLLQREVRLSHVLLQDPWADLVVDRNAGVNLMAALVWPAEEKKAEAPKTNTAELPFNIVFDSLQLTNGRFTFQPADDTTHLELAGLNISGSGNFKNQSGTLQLHCSSVRFNNGDIHPAPASILLTAHLNGEKLGLSTLKVISGETALNLSGSADHLYTVPVIDSVLTIDSQLAELAKTFNLAGDYSGPVGVHLTLNGTIDNPDAGLRLSVDKALVGGQPLDRGELAVDLKDRLVKIKTAALQRAGGAITLNGTADLRQAFPTGFLAPPEDINAVTYVLNLTHQVPELEVWVKRFIDLNGATNGKLSLTGRGIKPADVSAQLVLQGAAQNLMAPGMDRPVDAEVDLLARMDKGTIAVSRFNVVADGVKLFGEGNFQTADQSVAAKLFLTADDLSRVFAVAGVPSASGACEVTLSVDGKLNQPQFSVDLASKKLQFAPYTFGDIAGTLRLSGGTFFLDRLHLDNNASTFDATGSIHLLDPGKLTLIADPHFTFTANSDHVDPGDFAGSVRGDFAMKAALQGNLEKPAGQIIVRGAKAELSGQKLVDTLLIDARIEDKRIWLDQLLAIFAPGEQLKGGGSVGMDKSMDLYLKTSGISVANIQQLGEVFPGKGMLQLDAIAKGTIDNPDIDGHLMLTDLLVNGEAMEDARLTFGLHDMQAKVGGKLNFDVHASYDLKNGDFNGLLIFDETETAGYFRAAGKPDFHGTLTGQVEATGNIHDAENASVQMNLDALHLLTKGVAFIDSERISLKMADRQLTLPQFEMVVLSSGSLKVQGDALLVRNGGRLDMQLDGHIPLAVAGFFSDDLTDATGMITLQGGLTGDIAAPKIDARVELENIAMTVPGLVQKLHSLNGSIIVTPDDIRIEHLKGFLDTGSFGLTGTIAHEKFTPTAMNVDIAAKSLPLGVPDTLSMLVNADIKITGKNRIAGAAGEIVLLEGLYFKDVEINLLQAATDRKRAVAPASSPVVLPYFDTFNLDIKVKNRQPFYVRNNLADLEINPDLRIGGGLNRPIVSGRAEVKSGTITFQRKTFVVKKGVIDFINPYKTEAAIDIESETTIRDWTITLAVKGTPDNLDLKLSSVPTESDSDILSLILFGRTGRELVAGEGGGKRSTAQIMAEMIADTFGEDIKKNTGVDILQLDTVDGAAGQDMAGTRITVGKHLSDRITVKYAVESKDGIVIQRAIAEYKLLERILVSGFQDNQGIFGAELLFRLEFR